MRGYRNFLFQLYRKLTFGEFSIGEIDVESDMAYLDDLEEKYNLASAPSDDGLLRSFLQFKCQMRRLGKGRELILNLLSAPGVLVLLSYFFIRSFKKESFAGGGRGTAFLLPGVRKDLIPEELNRSYSVLSGNVGLGGGRSALMFFLKALVRFPTHFYFLLKVGHRIAQYQFILQRHDVEAIIGTSEYSFSSSAATAFLEGLHKKHVNVMHGEKLLFIRDAFVRYHRFFVWDDHYRRLFGRMKAPLDQFLVALPPSLLKNLETVPVKEKELGEKGRFVYYLANESSEDLRKIAQVGQELIGFLKVDFLVRFHPRYSDEKLVRSLFSSEKIEAGMTLSESIESAGFVCSIYSTVLFEAHLLSKTVVIDDVTSPRKFEALSKLDYVMIKKEHVLLSELLKRTSAHSAGQSMTPGTGLQDEK